MRIAILGAGAWGSALAVSFAARHEVALWTRNAADRERLERERMSRYLPEARIPDKVRVAGTVTDAMAGAELVIAATATAGLRETAKLVGEVDPAATFVWACKGFETESRLLPHQVVEQALPRSRRVGALSGPSFAIEVARGQPTAVVLASRDAAFASSTARN